MYLARYGVNHDKIHAWLLMYHSWVIVNFVTAQVCMYLARYGMNHDKIHAWLLMYHSWVIANFVTTQVYMYLARYRGGGIGAAGAAMAAPLFSSSKATPCRHTYSHAYLISNEIAIAIREFLRGKCLRTR